MPRQFNRGHENDYLLPTHRAFRNLMLGLPPEIFGDSVDTSEFTDVRLGVVLRAEPGEDDPGAIDLRVRLAPPSETLGGYHFSTIIEAEGVGPENAVGAVLLDAEIERRRRLYVDPDGLKRTGLDLNVIYSTFADRIQGAFVAGVERTDGSHTGLVVVADNVVDITNNASREGLTALTAPAACLTMLEELRIVEDPESPEGPETLEIAEGP